jgi:hypothetical protein
MPQAPLAAKEAKRRLAVGQEPLGSRIWLPAEQGSNPVSRDLAAECLRQADGPPAQGERRAPARVTLSAPADNFPLVQNGHQAALPVGA